MIEIDKGINDEVYKIVNELLIYKNNGELSWLKVYDKVLKKLEIDKNIINDNLLKNVVRRITNLGYDIIPIPFKLISYK